MLTVDFYSDKSIAYQIDVSDNLYTLLAKSAFSTIGKSVKRQVYVDEEADTIYAVILGVGNRKKLGSCLAERFFPEHFENEFVGILVSVVKPEFAFFQMKVKSVFCQPSKSYKARLGEGPEAFNAINM